MEKRLAASYLRAFAFRRTLLCLLSACILAAAGCDAGKSRPDAPPTKSIDNNAELSICFQNHNFNSFLPSELHFYNEAQLLELVFNTLVRADHAGHLSPDLATSWEISGNRLEYTFHLRPNAHFSNGNPLTSRDVIFTLEELIRRWSRENEFSCIIGAEEFAGNKCHSVSGLSAVNDHCVRIHLRRPFNLFLHLLASKAASVIPADYAGKTRDEFRLHPIGTGPFKFAGSPQTVTIKHQSFLKLSFLRRNDYFSNPASLKAVHIFLPQEPPRANTLYYFDVFIPPEGFAITTVPRQSHRVISTAPDIQVFIALNPSPIGAKPLSRQWRQILQFGINRSELIRDLGLERSALPAHTIIPVSLFGHNRYFRLDPERATKVREQLPDKARKTIKITIYPRHLTLISALNSQLAAFGLRLEADVMLPEPYYSGMDDQRRQAMIVRGVADYPHAYNFLSQLYNGNGLLNYYKHANPQIRELIMRLPLENIRSQAHLMEQLADLCAEDAWYIPLYFLSDNFVLRQHVNPLGFKFGGIIDFHAVEVNHESINGSD